MPRTRPPYPEQLRREAVELARKSGRPLREIANDLGVTEQSLRNWVKQADVDAGRAHGVSSEEKGSSCMNRGLCHRPGSGGQSPSRASIASAIAA